LNRAITVIKGMFKHVYENDLIDRPVKYGTSLEKPSASLKRKTHQAAELERLPKVFSFSRHFRLAR
jgi:hypothetical protein